MFTCLFIYFCSTFVADDMAADIKYARSLLKDITMLPLDAVYPDKIKKMNNYAEETMDGFGRCSAMSLLVYLSPATGEPMSMHVNVRASQIRSMNETTTIDVLKDGEQVSLSVNFLEDLIHDRENLVVTPGSHPIHVFGAAAEPTTRYIPSRELPDYLDIYLQTWMLLDYKTSSGTRPMQKVVMINQELRDITVKDINQLHYILNIPHYFKNTTVPVGKSTQPVIFFKYIFDKLRLMSLHDARLLRKFITNDLGIPLFGENERTLPIYTQWTRLSYFLQMCSPICLSPIEGGHRTLEMVKYFTGADFNNRTPQKIDPSRREGYSLVELRLNMEIQEQGLAMTIYHYTFWQRFDKTDPIGRQVARELQVQSEWFKQSQKVSCRDTNDSFLTEVFQRLDAAYACRPNEEFTTTKYFKSHDKGFETLNARLQKAYPVILDCIKTVSPAKLVWKATPQGEKDRYESITPPEAAIPAFEFL